MTKKPILIFMATSLLLLAIFFLFPINLFDGEIVRVEKHREYIVQAPLSLSYFIVIGYDAEDMTDVKTFYLTVKGAVIAVIFTIGIPAVLAYRIHLRNKK
jgi:Zn-dependent protease